MKFAMMTAAVALALPLSAGAQTVLRYADYSANRGVRAEGVMEFLAEVEKRSEGRIKIEQHWAQSLLPAPKILEGVINGVASIGTVSATYSPDDMFAYSVGDLPVTNPHEVAGALALYEMATTHPVVSQEFKDQGLVFLMNYSVGPIQMICKGEPPKSMEEFKGKKVRATGEYGQIYAAFGAIFVQLGLPDTYQGLDTGMIDCSQAYGYVVESYKLHEVSDSFVIIDGPTSQSHGVVISEREFAALDPKDQTMLIELGKEYTAKNAAAMRKRNQEVQAQLEKGGLNGKELKVVRFSDEDRAKLEQAGEPVIAQYVELAGKRGIDGEALVNDYRAMIARHLAEIKD